MKGIERSDVTRAYRIGVLAVSFVCAITVAFGIGRIYLRFDPDNSMGLALLLGVIGGALSQAGLLLSITRIAAKRPRLVSILMTPAAIYFFSYNIVLLYEFIQPNPGAALHVSMGMNLVCMVIYLSAFSVLYFHRRKKMHQLEMNTDAKTSVENESSAPSSDVTATSPADDPQ